MSRTGIMLCYPLELRRLEHWLAEDRYTICQPKFDGDRGRALLLKDRVELISSEGNDRNFALPHLVHELEALKPLFHSAGIYELDGEFYNHDLSHEQIHGICSRSTDRHPDHGLIEYRIFDHINTTTLQRKRLDELYAVAFPCNKVMPCVSYLKRSVDDIMYYYQQLIAAGYEGIICRRPHELYHRKRFTGIMKYKPKRKDTYTIVGYKEEYTIHNEPKGTLGALELIDPENNVFAVSAGLTHQQRQEYWDNRHTLIGRQCTIHYQAVTGRGIPKFVTDLEIE